MKYWYACWMYSNILSDVNFKPVFCAVGRQVCFLVVFVTIFFRWRPILTLNGCFWWELLAITQMELRFIDLQIKWRGPENHHVALLNSRLRAPHAQRAARICVLVVLAHHKIMKIYAHHLLPLPAGALNHGLFHFSANTLDSVFWHYASSVTAALQK